MKKILKLSFALCMLVAIALTFTMNSSLQKGDELAMNEIATLEEANADWCISCGLVSTDVCIYIDYRPIIGYRMIRYCPPEQ